MEEELHMLHLATRLGPRVQDLVFRFVELRAWESRYKAFRLQHFRIRGFIGISGFRYFAAGMFARPSKKSHRVL